MTSGFGVVFTDVDAADSTSLEFFDLGGNSLGLFFASPVAGNETFSFLGAVFPDSVVARVRINSGNSILGPDESGALDIVAMDDFIFGEPQPRPVPDGGSTWMLLLAGLGGLSGLRAVLKARRP